jgi:type IV pilus assembly protein PilC
MPEFSYIAVNKSGEIKRGIIASSDCSQLRRTMVSRGLELISCQEQEERAAGLNLKLSRLFKFIFSRRITPLEKISFAHHLAVMLKAGVPIIEAVDVLVLENSSPAFKKLIEQLGSELEKGQTISSCLEREKFFSPSHLAILKSGEVSGKVLEALGLIGNDLKRDYKMAKKIKGAMAYPAVIALALVTIMTFIIIFVLPKVGEVFLQMDLELPLATRILLGLSAFISRYFFQISAVLAILIVFLFFIFRRTKTAMILLSRFIYSLPLIRKIVHQMSLTRFIRSLSSLLASGVAIDKSLAISGKAFINKDYQLMIDKIGKRVKEGVSLTVAFKEYQPSFGGMLIKMFSVGEKSGRLAEILEELALFYEDEVNEKLENFSTIVEPILMILVGLGVGGMILSIIGPIYQMMGSLTP